jgi:hypothetical protein
MIKLATKNVDLMKSSSPQIEHLKLMLSLEEKRSALQGELNSLDAKLSDLKRRLVGGAAVASVSVSAPKVTATKSRPRSRRSGRGELKSQIFGALEKAGATGVKVVELAKSLGTKPANIYAWFHAALKRYPSIKKTGGGSYRLAGKAPASQSSPAKAPAKAAKAPAKSVAKSAAKAPAAKKGKKGGRSSRGEVSTKILAALGGAGANGITIKELSSKLGMPYRNLQVWFATTGKKNKSIKKVAPATYQLKK